METTTIEISHENWQWLSSLKQHPGDSFNDVISKLREQYETAGSDDWCAENNEWEEKLPDIRDEDESEQVNREIGSEGTTMDAGEDLVRDVADEVPDDLDLPGSGDTYEQRRQAIVKLYRYLIDEGTATRSDFLQLIDPDEVGYASTESFWANAVKGRNSLSALDGVIPPGEGGHSWRYEPEK